MWWPIINHFRNYLLSNMSFQNINIVMGLPEGLDPAKEKSVIISREDESGISIYDRMEGTCRVFVDIWLTRKGGEEDYSNLYYLEEKVMRALKAWDDVVGPEIRANVGVSIEKRISDGDGVKAFVGSRTVVAINYAPYRNEEEE